MSGKNLQADRNGPIAVSHAAPLCPAPLSGQTLMPQGLLECHQDIDPEALARMVGDDVVQGLQQKIGLSRADVLGRLKTALPRPERGLLPSDR